MKTIHTSQFTLMLYYVINKANTLISCGYKLQVLFALVACMGFNSIYYEVMQI